ncbi:MAG: phosphopantothenoylcysteine decarboxylase [Planctomycetaceae bacterium]|jgi:phosphopantothenoylcysteine decarboxylase/phosphopantothenate--cysteine ligase|nr:phosphopantothenoylcysteine decarboxylase [Planctomycetaceae bacterium]
MTKKFKVLITSGPTREYLDPVRFLSNASSGKMGTAIAAALIKVGIEPVIVSGPVAIKYPDGVDVHFVETTQEMLEQSITLFDQCIGLIGVAAPCDFTPKIFAKQKIAKPKNKNNGISIDLKQTADILAEIGKRKRNDQWIVGFALETDNNSNNKKKKAMAKLKQKNCDYIVLNTPDSINNNITTLEIFDKKGNSINKLNGTKNNIAIKLVKSVIPIRIFTGK